MSKKVEKVKVPTSAQLFGGTATVDEIAHEIEKISSGVRDLRSGKLNDRALMILLGKSSGVEVYKIQKVLDALGSMDKEYLKAKKA